MAEDVREAILAQITALMRNIPGVDVVVRNQLMDDDTAAKIIIVLEGDEAIDEADHASARNRPAGGPLVIQMHPQIQIRNFAKAEDVGSGLSSTRSAIIKAITGDATLANKTAKGRGGLYLGLESDLGFAREMSGQMAMKFQFTYVLRPSDLP